jgi:hexaprenyl-diphosphate synthase
MLSSLPTISSELSNLKSSLFHLLGSSHPSLDAVAKYYFQAEGKHLRPMLVLLLAQATNGLGGAAWDKMAAQEKEDIRLGRGVDESLTSVEGVLNDWNPEQMGMEGEGDMIFAEPYDATADRSAMRKATSTPTEDSASNISLSSLLSSLSSSSTSSKSTTESDLPTSSTPILSTQRRLASITEMIHVASLLHDDVIDTSPLRRGLPSAPQQFSNKLSILAGDFLLGRASVALARLGSNEVVELLATVIANLVEGEVMQLRATPAGSSSAASADSKPSKEAFEIYMRKTYLKTASLMAKSARAAVILGGAGRGYGKTAEEIEEGERLKDIAYGYGRNLGIAFQVRAGVIVE